MDPLNPLDAEFVEAEDQDRHVSMAIASIAVFEGTAPSYDEFVETIAERLPLVPRYRQKLRTVPLRLGPPMWVDDPHFDIRYHIRQTALPEPGGDPELADLMARVMSARLDRDRPLWEDWLVTGLAGGRWGLISKVHHSMVDGVSGTDLYRVMFDTPTDAPTGALTGREESLVALSSPEPSDLSLVRHAAGAALTLPGRAAGALANVLRHPPSAYRELKGTLRALGKLAEAVPPAPASSLSGPIGQERRYTWVQVPLDDVKMVKRELGGTVNDVVLAAISAGFRSLLLHRGETPVPHQLPSLVPVSLRAPGQDNIYENRVSAMIVELPVHLADPVEQLEAVRGQLCSLKDAGEHRVGEAFISLARYVPYPVASLTRFVFRVPQREIVTVTTNVPGPRNTLYCLGRPLVEMLPFVPIASTVRIGVAILSYCGQVTFGLTGDYDSCPDLEVLADGIRDAVGRLVASAGAAGGSPSRPLAGAQP